MPLMGYRASCFGMPTLVIDVAILRPYLITAEIFVGSPWSTLIRVKHIHSFIDAKQKPFRQDLHDLW